MKKIEKNKETLLNEAYKWIFDSKAYQAFTNWSNTGSTLLPSCRLLWIKGHAGTGKTMLLMGIIRELSSHSATLAPKVSHFFCQGTVKALNSSTATLRSLIWLLLVQQPHLISHLRLTHGNAGVSLFEGDCAFIYRSDAFEMYFVVDALDECQQDLNNLKKLILTSLTISDRVKWLVSSRLTVKLKTPETEAHVKAKVCKRAENTFLWVALVFKEPDMEDENQILLHGSYALNIVKETPSSLSKLYDDLMGRIEKGKMLDPQYCKNILLAAILAVRPLTLPELEVLAQLPKNMDPRTMVIRGFVAEGCGSSVLESMYRTGVGDIRFPWLWVSCPPKTDTTSSIFGGIETPGKSLTGS
ncbi:wd-repeat protein [Metarhizium acridum CQMa 102]|uniref:Wd-repeat protein n=1 Tax=Metarhizium acridum (strain CQMa 102) TaxID=655827 RepID=E9EB68_METAQ|nr:wd-repeat protein [Metarhizium acridum CQMa 102]EFY86801.1 wd-repeat protein [Metarhizium acridum CQMa 102]